ncbi:MAG: DUF5106 domain-containing protein [Sphingobacteriales bacterium]|nr:DUF5106 domain-containing protein [Sphingobacteriales bacterium]
MKRLLTAFILVSAAASAQTGYSIAASFKPFTKGYLYLGHHFGAKKMVVDSALIDSKGQANFKGKEKLPGGIYLVVNPQKSVYYEILMDEKQNFTVSGDTADLVNSIKVSGSFENELFLSYQKSSAQKFKQIQKLNSDLSKAKSKKDSAVIEAQIKGVNKANQDYRNTIIKKYPNTLLASLFNTLKEPVAPAALQNPRTHKDSAEAYYYYKSHYWDGVSFTDARLLRTPFFEAKLDRYLQQVVVQDPDSVKNEVDWIVLYSRANRDMFKYFISKFTSDYFYPKIMGQDAVFLLLFQKYYLPGEVDWFNEQQMKEINNRGYSLMANQLGDVAADLKLLDTAGKDKNLFSVNAPFTVVCFWDPDCSHCREELPKLDSMYTAKWKAQGVAIYAVLMDSLRADNPESWEKIGAIKKKWLEFIDQHNLNDWVNVYQTPQMKASDYAAKIPSPRQLYDVYQTPTLYLLDKNKKIIAKKLDLYQVNELIQYKLKNKKTN